MKSLEGHLLIAAPSLADPNFRRTVVLMIQHSDEGAFGLIINRPASIAVKDVWEQVSEEPCEIDATLHQGGPVAGPLMVLHTHPDLSEVEIMPGVHFSVNSDNIRTLVSEKQDAGKFFVGHAGWGPEQLEGEIEEGAWHTYPANLEHIFDQPGDLWLEALRASNRGRLIDTLDLREPPDEPSLN